MFARIAACFAALTLAAACVPAQEMGDAEDAEASVAELTASEEALVLAVVNDPSTDLQLLDIEIALDKRAAQKILAHRAGPDGVYPSPDDDVFDGLEELDAIPYVTATALERLRAWAVEHAMPAPETVEGVAFSSEQVMAVLWGVERATLVELDIDAALNKTAAQNLIAGRPYTSIAQMGAVAQVGPAALEALRARAAFWSASMGGGSIGTTPDGGECAATLECAADLVCSGTTLGGVGTCRPAWMAGTFTDTTDVAIPDGAPAGVSRSIEVTGLASVPEDVIVHLDIDHPSPAQLSVVLTQPSSAEAVIWSVGSGGAATVIGGWDVERDSSVNGTWTLTVVDTQTGQAGVLRGWSLELTSRWD